VKLAELLKQEYAEHYFPSDAQGEQFIDTLNSLAHKCTVPEHKKIFMAGIHSIKKGAYLKS